MEESTKNIKRKRNRKTNNKQVKPASVKEKAPKKEEKELVINAPSLKETMEKIEKEKAKIDKKEGISREDYELDYKEDEIVSSGIEPTNKKYTKLRIKNKVLFPIIIGLFLVAILLLLSYFYSPKNIFKRNINKINDKVAAYLDEYDEFSDKYDLVNKPFLISGEYKTTNTLNPEYNDYNHQFELLGSLQDEYFAIKSTVSNDTDSVTGQFIFDDEKYYLNSSVFEKTIDMTKYYELQTMVFDMMGLNLGDFEDNLKNLNSDNYKYIVKTITKEINDSLDSDAFSTDRVKIEINDKTIRTKKISYKVDKDLYKKTIKQIASNLKDNSDFVKKLAKMTNMDTSEVKDALKDMKNVDDIDFKDEMVYSIYVKGFNSKVVGITIEQDDDEILTLFYDDEDYELNIDNNDKEYRQVLHIEYNHEEETYKIKIKDDYQVYEIELKDGKEKVIDVNYKEDDITGKLYLTINEEKDSLSGDFKYEIKDYDDKMSINGKYKIEVLKELEKVSVKDAVSLYKTDFKPIKRKIKDIKDETLRDYIKEIIDELEQEAYDLNIVGMKTLTFSQAKSFVKTGTGLLYVGDTYYLDSEEEEQTLLDKIIELQDEYGFYSNYLSDYSIYSNAKCIDSTDSSGRTITKCGGTGSSYYGYIEDYINSDKTDKNTRPIVYAFKEGNLVGVIKLGTPDAEIDNILKEVGIIEEKQIDNQN